MRSNAKKVFYYHAEANSLGGFIEKPFEKIIPLQSSVSLPSVGGYATTRTHAFNFEEIVSCRSAYTRVSGSQSREDAPWSTLTTAVVEGLNILDVVTADRIVAQISADYPAYGGPPRYSLIGSRFEGLRLGGHETFPLPSGCLQEPVRGEDPSQSQLTLANFEQAAREQADNIVNAAKQCDDREGYGWLVERFGWLCSGRELEEDRWVLCSLLAGVDQTDSVKSFGHVVEIPDFGRVFLGELMVSRSSIQLTMLRAELGCAVKLQASAGHTGVGGHTVPPS
jgi:hypothetical protein